METNPALQLGHGFVFVSLKPTYAVLVASGVIQILTTNCQTLFFSLQCKEAGVMLLGTFPSALNQITA